MVKLQRSAVCSNACDEPFPATLANDCLSFWGQMCRSRKPTGAVQARYVTVGASMLEPLMTSYVKWPLLINNDPPLQSSSVGMRHDASLPAHWRRKHLYQKNVFAAIPTSQHGAIWLVQRLPPNSGQARERGRQRILHLSSHTGMMQVLPEHPLADPRSRSGRIQHPNPPMPRNTATNRRGHCIGTFANTKVILGKPWPAANNISRSK